MKKPNDIVTIVSFDKEKVEVMIDRNCSAPWQDPIILIESDDGYEDLLKLWVQRVCRKVEENFYILNIL